MFPGSVSTGPCVSWTVTVNDAVAVSPVTVSVTLQLTDVEPSPNTLPEASEQTTGLRSLPAPSVAFALGYLWIAPPGDVASSVTEFGTW